MYYTSTRNDKQRVTSAEAIMRGLSSDGGLFMPESFPKLTEDQLKRLSSLDYKARAKEILSGFLTDYSDEELTACIDGAYTAAKFGSDDPVPVTKLGDGKYVLELWHGPTCAFKDMALQIMPRFLTAAVKKSGSDKTVVILVATSGDTGKAALEGFCDVEGTKILVFYPAHGVSEVQRKQMTSQAGENTAVVGLLGNFDDCQNGVKRIFGDKAFADKLNENGYVFSSANSINWGRLVPQIVYYFSAYADLVKDGEIEFGEKVDFIVPTGNFGDILAGYIADRMGLPVGKLVCASNRNNVLTDFIETGVYDRNRDFHTTISPSMDILISSNLERLLYCVTGSAEKTAGYMKELAETGRYKVEPEVLSAIREKFSAGFATEQETVAAIGDCYNRYGSVIDPHTAVAYCVAKRLEGKNKQVILSTASPYKFPASVLKGLGVTANVKNEFELFDLLKNKSGMPVPASLAALADAAVRFDKTCGKDEMEAAVCDFLGITM